MKTQTPGRPEPPGDKGEPKAKELKQLTTTFACDNIGVDDIILDMARPTPIRRLCYVKESEGNKWL